LCDMYNRRKRQVRHGLVLVLPFILRRRAHASPDGCVPNWFHLLFLWVCGACVCCCFCTREHDVRSTSSVPTWSVPAMHSDVRIRCAQVEFVSTSSTPPPLPFSLLSLSSLSLSLSLTLTLTLLDEYTTQARRRKTFFRKEARCPGNSSEYNARVRVCLDTW
jgi:hypothetical protein